MVYWCPLTGYLLGVHSISIAASHLFSVVVYGQVSKSRWLLANARLQKQSNVRHDATPESTTLSLLFPSLFRSLSLPAAPLGPDNFAAGGAFFIEALKFPAQKFLTKLFIKVWPRGRGGGRGVAAAKDEKTRRRRKSAQNFAAVPNVICGRGPSAAAKQKYQKKKKKL